MNLQQFTKVGRTQRGGFWIVEKCAVCGTARERKSRPWRDKKPRRTCSTKCSNELKRMNSSKWVKSHRSIVNEQARNRRLASIEEYRERDRLRNIVDGDRRRACAKRSYRKHRVSRLEKCASYYQLHKEKIKERSLARYYGNRESIMKGRRAKYQAEKNVLNARRRQKRKENPEAVRAQARQWRSNESAHAREHRRQYQRDWYRRRHGVQK